VRLAIAAMAAASVIAGCGSGDDGGQTYTAAGFIAAANAEDAGLELGEPLPYPSDDAVEVRVLRFQGAGEAPTTPGAETPTDVHGSGTLSVFAEDSGAVTEFERCQAGGLICMRAANVALTFSGDVAPADLERLSDALQALSSNA
jgi:hypothetical protein